MDPRTPPAGDAGLARWMAARAGDLLLALRADKGHRDPDALRAAGDRCSHELITAELSRWRPADAVLSEEGTDTSARLAAERVWIVDPLDGTREYGEPGRVDWAVHVALWSRTAAAPCGLTAAAVALPAQRRVIATDDPPGYPPMSADAAAGGRLRRAASRSRPPAFLDALA